MFETKQDFGCGHGSITQSHSFEWQNVRLMSKTLIHVQPRCPVRIRVALAFVGLSIGMGNGAEPSPQMSAARFEKMFLQSMPDHHNMAVQTSQICLEKTQRPELRALCQQIITSQQREIGTMQGWLNKWYELQKLLNSVGNKAT